MTGGCTNECHRCNTTTTTTLVIQKTILYCVALLIVVGYGGGVAAMGINNFRFPTTNTIYSDTINQLVSITGVYYIDFEYILDTEDAKEIRSKGFNTETFLQCGDLNPYYCTGDTDQILADFNHTHQAKLDEKINELKAMTSSSSCDGSLLNSHPIKLFIDVAKDKYKCNPLTLTKVPKVGENEHELGPHFTFKIDHTFVEFEPVVFVDVFGIGSFNFKQKKNVHDVNLQKGSLLRFCGGHEYTGELYTIEPRPTCPHATAEEHRIEELGRITVYKPNIVSVQHPVYKCTMTRTFLKSSLGFFGQGYNNDPPPVVSLNVSAEDCRKWVQIARSNSDENITNNFKIPYEDTVIPINAGKIKRVGEDNSWATNNEKQFKYKYCCFDIFQNIYDGYVEESIMAILLPSMRISTPWRSIPSSKLYDNNDVSDMLQGTLVWDRLDKSDVCFHVKYLTADVKAITYTHGSHMLEMDPNPGATNMTYFVSDRLKALYEVDDTQLISDDKKYNCIHRRKGDRLYLTRQGLIIKYSPGDFTTHPYKITRGEDMHYEEHPHSSFAKIRTSHVKEVQSNIVSNLADGTAVPVPPTTQKIISNTKLAPYTWGQNDTGVPPDAVVRDYVSFVNAKIAKKNAHERVMDSCKKSQADWELYSMLMDMDPTRAISQRERRAVEATHGGNGVYNVRECELINSAITVVSTLKTNSSLEVIVNRKAETVRDIVRKLGVTPNPKLCLSNPIIVFTPEYDMAHRQLVGQLELSGKINTDYITTTEECDVGKHHAFILQSTVFFYADYEFKHGVPFKDVMNKVTAYGDGSAENKTSGVLSQVDDMISKLKVLHVTNQLKEEVVVHTPTGLLTNDLYTRKEKMSPAITFYQVVTELSRMKTNNMRVKQQLIKDLSGIDGNNGKYYDTSANEVLEGIGDFIVKGGDAIGKAFSGMGNGIGQIFEGAGNGLGSLASGVGDGIESTLDGAGTVVEGFGDAFQSLIVPIVVGVLGLAFIGIIILVAYAYYKKGGFKNDKSKKAKYSDDEEEDDYS